MSQRVYPRHRRALFLALFVLFGSVLNPIAARAGETDSQFWAVLTFNARFKNKLRFYAEVQPRWGEDYSKTALFILRPAVGYQIKPNLSLWLGYGWTPSFLPEFTTEDRFFQQILLEDRYPRGLEMINRTRLEQRNIGGAGDLAVRLRHMVRLNKSLDAQNRWLAVWYNELFWNLSSTPTGPVAGFDQNRVYFGVGYNANRHTRFELGYLASFINPPRGAPDRRFDVLVLSINYNL